MRSNAFLKKLQIDKVERLPEADVYDVEMPEEPNFVLANGAVAHNCRAHAVCYASLLGYACAWLKHHYPLEWWCAVLRNASKDDINTKFWQHCGYLIDLPDVASAIGQFEIRGDRIQAPASLLTGIGDKALVQLVEGAPYTDILDLCNKIEAHKVATGIAVIKNKKIKVKVEGQKKKEDQVIQFEALKKGSSALNRGILYKLIISGSADGLFPKDTSTLEKLALFEQALATSTGKKHPAPVPEKYININAITRFQMRKEVLPAYSEPLTPLLLPMDVGLTQGDRHVTFGKDRIPLVDLEKVNLLENGKPYCGPHTVAIAAYVKEIRKFQYGPKKEKSAIEYILSVDGGDLKTVKWVGAKRLPPVFAEVAVGAICVYTLTKFAEDRPFAVDGVVIAQKALDNSAEKSPEPEDE